MCISTCLNMCASMCVQCVYVYILSAYLGKYIYAHVLVCSSGNILSFWMHVHRYVACMFSYVHEYVYIYVFFALMYMSMHCMGIGMYL